jgi:hypothetical protein
MKQSIPLTEEQKREYLEYKKEYKRKMRYVFETMEMAEVFNKDIKKIIEFSETIKYESEAQFWMRVMVRTIVDSIDALIFRLRKTARELIELRGIENELPPKPKKINLRYIFKVLAIAFNSTFEIKEDDEKLKDYSEARAIRNRITHPKELTDLNISLKGEYVKFSDTFIWVSECIKKLSKQSKIPKKPQDQ